MPIGATPNAGLSVALRNQFAKQQGGIAKSIERLSTGKRINRPSDDPAGFIAAEQVRGELTNLSAELKTYDLRRLSLRERSSQLATYQSQLNDIRGKIVEATGDQIGESEKTALQQQVDAAFDALEYIASRYDSSVLGNDLSELSSGEPANLVDGDTARAAEIVGVEISSVGLQQASLGAGLKTLDTFEQLAQDKQVILSETLSQIEDTDFAEETASLAVSQTLAQAATAALAYSQQTHADTVGELLDRVETAPGRLDEAG